MNYCTLPHAKRFRKRGRFGTDKNTKCAELRHARGARRAPPLNMSFCVVFPSRLRHMYIHVLMRSFCKSSTHGIHSIYCVKIQVAARKYPTLCQFCENLRDSKIYARPNTEERNNYAKACSNIFGLGLSVNALYVCAC